MPQIVVCGAQSAGKSSVLEGLTGIPFPREDGVCTKFATEIILRHQPGDTSITASITFRNNATKNLRRYKKRLTGYHELPGVVEHVSKLMEVRGFCDSALDHKAPPFAKDVLRIEVVGEVNMHLTVVDLPGLISVDDRDRSDVTLVENLVD